MITISIQTYLSLARKTYMKKSPVSTQIRHLAEPLQNKSGTAMVFVLVVAVIGGIVMASFFFTSRLTIKKSGNRRAKVGALNIAEAGKETFYAKLLNDQSFTLQPNASVMVYTDEVFGNGTYSVKCITNADINRVTVQAWGREGANCVKLEVEAEVTPTAPLNFPTNIGGLITSRYSVDLTGNVTVDGRDYDSLGNLVGNGGYGVYTCMNMNINGSAVVGGNGVAPVAKGAIAPVRSSVCYEMAPITSSYSSPEAFLGVPVGSLDRFKVSALPASFEGIVYIDGDCTSNDIGNSAGILIIHNSTSTAQLHLNKGTFKGLIICDVMDKSNGNFSTLGAIVALGTSKNSKFGNGNAVLRYSSQVLSNLDYYCKNVQKMLSELSWKEMSCN